MPVRGAPVTMIGLRTSSSRTPGSSATYAASWKRTSSRRSRYRRVIHRPSTVRWASSSSAAQAHGQRLEEALVAVDGADARVVVEPEGGPCLVEQQLGVERAGGHAR